MALQLRRKTHESIVYIDKDSAPRIMPNGEDFILKDIPIGTRVIYPLLILLLFSVPAAAQKNWPLSVPKHNTVVLKIARTEMSFSKWSTWTNRNSYAAVVDRDQTGRITVNGRADWNDVGWPLMTELRVEDTSYIKPKDKDPFAGTEVMLKASTYNVIVRFAASIKDVGTVFDELTVKGTLADFQGSDYYKKEIVGRFVPRFFKGKLGPLSDNLKLFLLKSCDYETNCFGEETYKEKDYLMLKGKLNDFVLNSSKLSQMQRVGWAFNERLLNLIKGFEQTFAKDLEGFHGLKVEYVIPYRNLIDNTGEGSDYLIIYVSKENVRLFREFEITGQDLVDRSVVIVGNNRIKADLNLQY